MDNNRQDEERLRQIIHDVRHCLHVIGMGTELLKDARTDDEKFATICESIDREREQAERLIDELLQAARKLLR